LAVLIVWHLRKVVPSPAVTLSITYGVHTDAMTLCWCIRTLLSPSSYCNGFERCKDE